MRIWANTFFTIVSWALTTVLMPTLTGWVSEIMIRWANRVLESHVRLGFIGWTTLDFVFPI